MASPSKPRPLSPHLQIYKPQLTSILSILHRMTGMTLTLLGMFIVCWLYHVVEGEGHYLALNGVMQTSLGRGVLMVWSFALFYHLLNGIRHLLWDIGMGFEIKEVYATGYTVMALSVLLTCFFWGVILWH
jgi:succinate dehydrogenase / fumarate reductase cytochrome b subunit